MTVCDAPAQRHLVSQPVKRDGAQTRRKAEQTGPLNDFVTHAVRTSRRPPGEQSGANSIRNRKDKRAGGLIPVNDARRARRRHAQLAHDCLRAAPPLALHPLIQFVPLRTAVAPGTFARELCAPVAVSFVVLGSVLAPTRERSLVERSQQSVSRPEQETKPERRTR